MTKTKSDKNQGELFQNQGMFPYFIPDEAERVDACAKFVVERHKIYLKKEVLKQPKPWTDDPILQNFSFTNVYRELDRVSKWVRSNVMDRYQDHPDLPFMLAITRVINWPDTLQELMDEGAWPTKKWDAKKFFGVLRGRAQRKEKVVTGAYIVNSVTPKGELPPTEFKKPYAITFFNFDKLWHNRQPFQAACRARNGGTMGGAVAELTKNHGWGPFLAYQVVVDLSYMNQWLKRAKDYNTFTSPGPGTRKGTNWMSTGRMNGKLSPKQIHEEMLRFRQLVNEAVKAKVPNKWWTNDMRTGFEEISMSNYSNCMCELSKMVRSQKDGGANMKNKYSGAK